MQAGPDDATDQAAKAVKAEAWTLDHLERGTLPRALDTAQLEQIETFVGAKRVLAERYAEHLRDSDLQFVSEPPECRSNYWLNAVICTGREQRDELLRAANEQGVMTRPIWRPMSQLQAFADCANNGLNDSMALYAPICASKVFRRSASWSETR